MSAESCVILRSVGIIDYTDRGGRCLVASIVRQKIGDKIYLYESVSYRNAEGQPRNRRVLIGKIDPATGQPVLSTHVYYHALKAVTRQEEVYAQVTVLKDRAEVDPPSALADAVAKKYLIIRQSAHTPSGYTVNIRDEVVAKELQTAGWLVVVSNDVVDAKQALAIYRHKDVVEKGFLRLKVTLDLGRLRVHRDDRMQNKVFIGFIALILLSHLHNVMLNQNLYQRTTLKKLLLTFSQTSRAAHSRPPHLISLN